MKDIANFIAGFRHFQEKYCSADRELCERMQQRRRLKALIVAYPSGARK